MKSEKELVVYDRVYTLYNTQLKEIGTMYMKNEFDDIMSYISSRVYFMIYYNSNGTKELVLNKQDYYFTFENIEEIVKAVQNDR